ncbi:helix-turn-helix transcriptional regulator [Aestuariicella hydrocarbonica]|uniref:Helix-turn-helix transcriptional regulator n=1 Tax=Pseudomaricurvus hydrocarbonicus TaxID=1470433 RepID=A0A9E5JTB0_9GAMM|nr:helix-turn-helix transcriptional regulator [Aestuariicella hydrocarbonica]NHO64924.1 helix-turn-helix transcriptional regulator [Aestuariicella hydrocarbonica]
MDVVLTAALAFSLSQILLNVLLFLRSRRGWSVQSGLYAVFLLAVTGYLLTPVVTSPGLSMLFEALQTLVPGTFWLFSASLFEERFRLRSWQMGLVALTVLLPLLGNLLAMADVEAPRMFFWTLPQSLEFVIMGLALWSVVRFWREDLVESRRDLRLWFCGILGLYILVLLLMRELIFPGEVWLLVWQYIFVAGMLMVTNGLLLEMKTGLFHPEADRRVSASGISAGPAVPRVPVVPDGSAVLDDAVAGHSNRACSEVVPQEGGNRPPANADEFQPVVARDVDVAGAGGLEPVPEALLQQLTQLMEHERVYRQMGLTIGQLAASLSLPEYRLRKVINAGLGYRNFNDFLNTYRIREASERLADPLKPDEAILNIALDTGYRSLSSFNKAFKEAFGQTPTEYRQGQLRR